MIQLTPRCTYKNRRYPLVALLDLFFLLLLLFVMKGSKLYVQGTLVGTNAGHASNVPTSAAVLEGEREVAMDRPYVVADQIVLAILPKTVTSFVSEDGEAVKTASEANYTLELNNVPVTLEALHDNMVTEVAKLGDINKTTGDADNEHYRARAVVLVPRTMPVALLGDILDRIRVMDMDVVVKQADY